MTTPIDRPPAGSTEIVVHYHRSSGDYHGWHLWTWNVADKVSRPVFPVESDSFGLVFRFVVSDEIVTLGLLPRRDEWADKEPPERFWLRGNSPEIWIVAGRPQVFVTEPDTSPFVAGAWIDGPSEISAWLSTAPPGRLAPERFVVVDSDGKEVPVLLVRPGRGGADPVAAGFFEVRLDLGRALDPGREDVWAMTLRVDGYRSGNLSPGRILDGPGYASDLAMGAQFVTGGVTFRVFAPTADRVFVNLYDKPAGGVADRRLMTRSEAGLWELTVDGDLAGHYYTLSALGRDPGFDPARELVDPYSRCTTAHDGRSLLFRDDFRPEPGPTFPIEDAVIAELHIRDFTVSPDSGVRAKGRYLGAAESGTRLTTDRSMTTGFDHLLEMGINTVQVMPVTDFENVETGDLYNWGYMPVHFLAPDGWYASEVTGPSRVIEAREMIDVFHRRGIKVVLDVVLNHTAEKRPAKVFSLEGLAPGYYYRLRPDGTYWDGSGTGNEFRSEAPMARKLLLDALKHWVTAYGVDGFRFDLMGLIDRETLEIVGRELRLLRPDIFLYGEPWTGGPTPIAVSGRETAAALQFGVFNDDFRDAVKGPLFDKSGGYVQEGRHAERVRTGLKGSIDGFALRPADSINYVECHDNLTLWDRLVVTTGHRADVTEADRIRMDRMAAAIVLLAHGIPFIQSGQEMLRTKGGNDNTFDQPDRVNQIVWNRKKEFIEVVRWYRELIAIRSLHPLFRKARAEDIRNHFAWLDRDLFLRLPDRAIGFRVDRGAAEDSWEAAVVLFHPGEEAATAVLPAGPWHVFVDGDRADASRPLTAKPLSGHCPLAPRSVVVLARPV